MYICSLCICGFMLLQPEVLSDGVTREVWEAAFCWLGEFSNSLFLTKARARKNSSHSLKLNKTKPKSGASLTE